MDIQKIINEVLEKLQGDEGLLAKFKKEPVKTLEGIIGVALPDDKIDAVVKGIMAKINLDAIADKAGDLFGALGGLFGKK